MVNALYNIKLLLIFISLIIFSKHGYSNDNFIDELDISWNSYINAVKNITQDNQNPCTAERMDILYENQKKPVKLKLSDLKKEKIIDHSGPHILLEYTNNFSHFFFTRKLIKDEPEDSPIFGTDISNIKHENLNQYYPGFKVKIKKNDLKIFEAFGSDDGASLLVNFNKGNGNFKLTYRWTKGYGNGEFDNINKVDFYAKCKAVKKTYITKKTKDKKSSAENNIVGYYEGELRYPDGTLPVFSEIYFNNNKILEGKYYFIDFDGEKMEGKLSSFRTIGKNSFNIKWKDKYNNGWLKVILVGDDFEGKFGVRANERTGYWSGYKVSLSVFNREKKNLFGDQNKKDQESNIEIVKDTEGPIIEINKEFTADQNFTASIKGLVKDDNEIALVSVDGEDVSIKNGKFSSSIYVPPKGKNIEVVAIDKNGNKSTKIISVIRGEIAIVKNTFDFLDPRKIKVKTNNNSVALIIGIEKYQNTFTAPFAENDALAFNDFAHTSLGVPLKNIKLLTNDDAGRTNTIKTLAQWLPKVVSENKTNIYIFYSGHGLASEDGEDLYLLPADGDPELLEDSTILRNQLFERIAKLNPKSVTVFLDTCYSGGTRSDEILVASRPIFIEAEEQNVPVNFTIFSASAGKETAKVLKEAEHGLFSYYMMKGLEGEADGNNDNKITNGELHAFINKNVSRQANQTPQLNGDPEKILLQW